MEAAGTDNQQLNRECLKCYIVIIFYFISTTDVL